MPSRLIGINLGTPGTPPTPPPVPPALSAPTLVAAVISNSQINLTASYTPPPGLSTYTFQIGTAPGGPFTTLATQASPNFSATGLSISTQYYFQVNVQTSESPSRTSAWSAVATGKTLGAPLVITTGTLPNAQVGVAYAAHLSATGGTPPYTWSVTSDSPDTGSWLTINAATGTFGGTPGTAETETLTVKVVDSLLAPATEPFTLVVNPAVLPPPPPGGINFAPLIQAPVFTGSWALNTQSAGQKLSCFDYVTFSLYGEGSGNSVYTGTLGGYLSYIQGFCKMPNVAQLALYYDPSSVYNLVPSAGNFETITAHIVAENWWLYNNGTGPASTIGTGSGEYTPNFFDSSWPQVNTTEFVPLDSSGFNAEQYVGDWFIKYHVFGTAGGSFQAVDHCATMPAVFHDNFFAQNLNGGDYERSGSMQAALDPTVSQSLRNCLASGVAHVRSLFPTVFVWVNTGGQWRPGNSISGLSMVPDGGWMEGFAGTTYGEESGGYDSWSAAQAKAQFVSNNVTTLVGYNHVLSSSNGSDILDSTPYRASRYMLAFALADPKGVYSPSIGGSSYPPGNQFVFDEWAVNSSGVCQSALFNAGSYQAYQAFKNWMGARTTVGFSPALSGIGTGIGNGIIVTRFANCVVLLNPNGNGAQNYNYFSHTGKHLKLLSGTQGTVNTGATVASVSMANRDGLVAIEVP